MISSRLFGPASRRQNAVRLIVSLALAGGLLSTGCGGRQKHASHAASDAGLLRVGILSTTGRPNGAEGWAQRRGLLLPALKPAGVTRLQFASFAHGPDLNEALASGAVDVGLYSDTPAIIGHAAGIPTRVINQTAVGNNCWLIVRADGPRTVDELKGKTVATAKGTFMSRYLLGLLAEKGLTDSVKVVHLPSDAEAALQHGDIAAFAGNQGPLMISHGFRAIDQAAQHPSLEGSSVTVVTAPYLAAHPQFPAVWNAAHTAAVNDLLAHQDDYYRFEAGVTNQPLAIVEASSPVTRYTRQPFTPRGLALLSGTKAFLVGQHLVKNDFPVVDWIIAPQPARASSTHTNIQLTERDTDHATR